MTTEHPTTRYTYVIDTTMILQDSTVATTAPFHVAAKSINMFNTLQNDIIYNEEVSIIAFSASTVSAEVISDPPVLFQKKLYQIERHRYHLISF